MITTRGIAFLLLAVSAVMVGCKPPSSSVAAPVPTHPAIKAGAKSSGGKHASIAMDQGTIEIELLPDAAPRAVENFRLLAEHKLYDGLTFHRIIRDFMIQGGDPQGSGMGGMSAWGGTFPDEIQPTSALYQAGYKRGIVAMANSGPDSNTSQFFIMHADYRLPPKYVIFGKVTKGIEVVDMVVAVPKGPGDRPITPVVMRKVTIQP